MQLTASRYLPLLLAAGLLAPRTSAQEEIPEAPADWAVTDALETRLLLDSAIDLNDVDVHVREGIAEFTGEVDNLLAKRRATYLAEMVKGVRSVSNRIRVVPQPARWDRDVRRDVIHALLMDPATDSYEIDVAVEDGKVVLEGQVDSHAEKVLTERVATGVRGVVDVENRIVSKRKLERPDTEIAPEIRKRLQWDVLVEDGLVDVVVVDGDVTLSGTVGSAAERRKAEDDAWVAGVRSVDSTGLHVRPWAKDEDLRGTKYVEKSPDEIADAIKWAASYDPRVLSFHIEPQVRLSWVTLRGTVDNLQAKRAAEHIARHTVGVVGVTNLLKVREPEGRGARADREILADIRRSFGTDSFVDRDDIAVLVDNGMVTLKGDVDTHFERAQAEELVSRIRGVRAIANRLMIDGSTVSVDPGFTYPWLPPVIAMPHRPNLSDDAIEENIGTEFDWSPFVDPSGIKVSVEDGVATLTGDVDTWREYHAATSNAYEGGARKVRNELNVR